MTFAGLILACAGFFVGQNHPAHKYQQFGQSKYLYDSGTGRLCLPFPEAQPLTALDTLRNQLGEKPAGQTDVFDRLAQAGTSHIPQCGSE